MILIFFKIIESKGWYFYDPDDCNHRRRMFILLINYFTFVTNGSFTKFIKTKNYGIDFSGKKEEFKTYFFFHSSSIPSFDPVLSILYLLNHINVYNKGRIGDYQLKIFPFINQ
ncbi:hypothetical protein TUBRATIS_25370 [Tubulinosema ratisbonensis]|uniref:Uncharacterized protein n=1 Tax=Tubulinosema ratisbonensis TaxID=291195 RepID=A0A437AIY4_9MICR|nr:hypothetical protein TUBRATIS_25370 [Tubulinosema ratisbonensis]